MTTSSYSSRNQQKRELLERFLQEDYAFIHLKVRTPGVVLPLNVMQEQMTTLKISYNFQGKMTLSDEGLVAELSFGNKAFPCKIPWEGIWAMTSLKDERLMWTDELPPEVLEAMAKDAKTQKKGPQAVPTAVEGSSDEGSAKKASAPAGVPAPAKIRPDNGSAATAVTPAETPSGSTSGAASPDSGERPSAPKEPPCKSSGRPQLRRIK